MRQWAILLAIAASGCSQEHRAGEKTEPVAAPVPRRILASVRAVGLDGTPVPGIMPIATTDPNAFDEPFAKGQLTGPDGRSAITIEPGRHTYVRGWDPALRKFANNYVELLPVSGNAIEEMVLVMVSGAALEAALLTPDGVPAANVEVRLMMVHPAEGPWWPATAVTDADGLVRFGAVPAGNFAIRLVADDIGEIEFAEVMLPPNGTVQLGRIVLDQAGEDETLVE
ncbi:MAG TPA: carboxypeptidase regulatory-like domain-containing protein [Candidatus Hydrogenedentes bacterium]|nr:carboxypeptidase regulatory-like domain-containing protein [Candidatus Hydrogenedentota bacterium]HIJ73288.1 carboxypeptidase regulatory-like domain-containing protein [Candidatus Hydrogenedentota bacterium]